MDKDTLSDDSLGEVKVAAKVLAQKYGGEHSYPVSLKGKNNGELFIRTEYKPQLGAHI